MKIVLDLQGAQSSGSRTRGIGRYTLAFASALGRNAGSHEVHIALSGLFPDTIDPIERFLKQDYPAARVHVWHAPQPVQESDPANRWRREVAERLREGYLASLRPDVVHVSSLFEGFGDDSVTSIGVLGGAVPTSVSIYDLIPLVNRQTYLSSPSVEDWYERKLGHVQRAGLWLAISEFSRREAIDHLGLPEEWVVNAPPAADARFKRRVLTDERVGSLRHRYQLDSEFVMYTGGIDLRKNIEGLIRAYSQLPHPVRAGHQLAIVCNVQPGERAALERLAQTQGLRSNDMVLTGFVPDEDLVDLYNLCTLFAFPSWHEGFGLPALEAMACGAAVIGASTSSVPEVIGREDALFNPHSIDSMASKLNQALTDGAFRHDLQTHGAKQARTFSWDKTARLVVDAFAHLHEDARLVRSACHTIGWATRPRLAYVSPLPPTRSGVAAYGLDLLPSLSQHYEIDVIVREPVTDPWVRANCPQRSVDWFAGHAHAYNRVLYQFGNSAFHEHMLHLIEHFPGVVILHDFFLSGLLAYLEGRDPPSHPWTQALYDSHGYMAVKERFDAADPAPVIYKYPCNVPALRQALGVIVHSRHARSLASKWGGDRLPVEWTVIPLPRRPAITTSRDAARRALGMNPDDFLTCSFGMVNETKLDHRLLSEWLRSSLGKDERARLAFVGECPPGAYKAFLNDIIIGAPDRSRVTMTGYVTPEEYRTYMAAADVAVQLRTSSRGETSAALLDCLNVGVATIVNSHGSNVEIPTDCVCRIEDDFKDGQLAGALERLRSQPDERAALGLRASAYVRTHHSPRRVATLYAEAIERSYCATSTLPHRVIRAIDKLDGAPSNDAVEAWLPLATAIAQDFPSPTPQPQLLVDITTMESHHLQLVKDLLTQTVDDYRLEPVCLASSGSYHYARSFTLKALNCPAGVLKDEVVTFGQSDVLLRLIDLRPADSPVADEALLRRQGVRVYWLVGDERQLNWQEVMSDLDGIICLSRTTAKSLSADIRRNARGDSPRLAWLELDADDIPVEPAGGAAIQPYATPSEATLQRLMALLSNPSDPLWLRVEGSEDS